MGDTDGDESDGALEVLALQDVEVLRGVSRSDVVKEHINDEAGLRAKIQAVQMVDGLGFAETLNVRHRRPDQVAGEGVESEKVAKRRSGVVDDDLKREARFVALAKEAVERGLAKLRADKVPFRRPTDYYAEMVKSDNHMKKVKERMVYEREKVAAAEQRRKQRTSKRDSRKVQIEKEQMRKQQAKQQVAAVEKLRKDRLKARANRRPATDDDDKGDDGFPVDLLELEELQDGKFVPEVKGGVKRDAKKRAAGEAPKPSRKRQQKDKKYGFGGRKRAMKRNDAKSAAQMTEYSAARNKQVPKGLKVRGGSGVRKPTKKQRPGKARRQRSR